MIRGGRISASWNLSVILPNPTPDFEVFPTIYLLAFQGSSPFRAPEATGRSPDGADASVESTTSQRFRERFAPHLESLPPSLLGGRRKEGRPSLPQWPLAREPPLCLEHGAPLEAVPQEVLSC